MGLSGGAIHRSAEWKLPFSVAGRRRKTARQQCRLSGLGILMKTDFDIVIIGSGAGGAPIAYEMAKAGKSVLVLEKGPLIRPQYQCANQRSSFKRDELISDGMEKRLTLAGLTNT